MVLHRAVELAPFIRWDEKAGLRRDAIRSQWSTRSKRNRKETGYEKGRPSHGRTWRRCVQSDLGLRWFPMTVKGSMERFRWAFHNIDASTLIQFLLLPVALFIFSKATM